MKQELQQFINDANSIVVLQADNPDADSLGSALALEQILGEMGKSVSLYCGVDIPGYLKYLPGWDRVGTELPHNFDLSIIVDASTITLFDKLQQTNQQNWVASKPCIIFDHHTEVNNIIPFATVNLTDDTVSSTGELIYNLAKELDWPIDIISGEYIMTAILGDTQGLSNNLTTAQTYRIMADLTDLGVDRPILEEKRREISKMHPEILRYKAKLIEQTILDVDGQLALVHIPQDDITKYSPLYNPNALIQPEHLQTQGVRISVAVKSYSDGRITASIRCNSDAPIASQLAEHFGGGGHKYAAGFKILSSKTPAQVIAECTEQTSKLLATIANVQESRES
ncbi:DHH family phosphoesterase [Candidatus Saccharibacteria bacterium]|nr:DHH family phosphoesterase [Candidatus Saccharibacteria bacterium]